MQQSTVTRAVTGVQRDTEEETIGGASFANNIAAAQ